MLSRYLRAVLIEIIFYVKTTMAVINNRNWSFTNFKSVEV